LAGKQFWDRFVSERGINSMSDNWALNGRQDYEKRANSILTMGIIALICGTVIFTGIAGMVLGIINIVRIKSFIRQAGNISRKVVIAKKLSVAAIVFGSVITAYWLFIAVLFIYQFVTAVFVT
jgi:uncharacterized membrane protein YidH (DUF202 family)